MSSHLYRLCFFNFSSKDFQKAEKLFLQQVFCLPDSFPITIAVALLGLQHFGLSVFDSRMNFAQRALADPFSLTGKVLRFDDTYLQSSETGFSHDLMQFMSPFFDFDLDPFPSITDLTALQDLHDQLSIKLNSERSVSSISSSGLSFWAS